MAALVIPVMSIMPVAFVLLSFVSASVQTSVPPETKQFDFWIGDWKCSGESYDAKGTATHTDATNTITSEFDGHVVQEHFQTGSFHGTSVSVYVPTRKQWFQTWVDNQGAYIALSGNMEGGKMILQTLANPKRPKAANRMIFENISPESFDWNWQSTKDGGKNWTLNWHLHYDRVKK